MSLAKIRFAFVALLPFFLVAVLSFGSTSARAVDPWYLCTGSNVTPGSECTSVIADSWTYTGVMGGAPTMGGFPSIGALASAMQAYKLSNPWVCSFPISGTFLETEGTPYWGPNTVIYQYGIDILHQHQVTFTETSGNEFHPCENVFPVTMFVAQTRNISCPVGYALIYASGPPEVPAYCARPWTLIDPGKCPSCAVKGNPVDIATGNKLQKETDYRSANSSPLSFSRYYDSRFGNSPSPLELPAPRFPSGNSWMADYFQKVAYSSFNGFSSAIAYRPDGYRLVFREISDVFEGPADSKLTLIAQRASGVITGWSLKLASDAVENYDGDGRLTSIVERDGRTQTLAYDSAGKLSSVTDSFGNQLVFTFGSNGLLATLTHPGGGTTNYTYHTNKNLISATDALGNVRQYLYEIGADLLTGIIDENVQRHSTYSYNPYTLYAESTELAGSVNKYIVSYSGDLSRTVTDPLGTDRAYSFSVVSAARRMNSVPTVTGSGGEDKALTYDANANVTSKLDFNNNVTCYAYDLARNLESVRVEGFAPASTCPVNLSTYTPTVGTRERKTTTVWHSTFRLPTSITESNRTTTFTDDANGNVLTRTVTDTSVVPNVARIWTYTYNAFGRVLTENGPRTDVTDLTTYAYYTCTTGYQCGQLNSVTNALSQVTTYNSYNAHGQPTQITDANGLVTSLAYDARQRITDRCTGSTLPACTGGELTHLDYWPTGLLKKVANPDASYIQYTYDNAHRLTQINDGALNKIVYTLDNMGNRTAENSYDPSNALKRTHSRAFNTLNQLWKDVNAAGTANVTTVFGYDSNGNQNSVAAPLSRNSSNLYDELNRLKQITDPNSGVTQFGYDANDNLTSVTDPRTLATSYTYTGFGDLKTQTSPDTGLTTNTYDSGGNLKTSTDARNAITTYTYDAMNRVGTVAFKIGSTTDQTFTYTYDSGTNGKGHLTGASDGTNPLAWTYDSRGRVVGKAQQFGVPTGPTLAVGNGYNALGQLFHLVLPSGKAITYGYNSNGQITSVTLDGSPGTTILNNVTYDPFGPVTGWTWGNGTASTSRTFDTDGKLTTLTNTASVVGNQTFGYDDAFRITSTTDSASGGPTWTLGYDILDRLNSAVKTGSTTIGYTYDANGNRLTQTGTTASTYTVSGASNKLSSTTGGLVRTYTYDNSGSVLTSGVTTHTYYNSGRMKTANLGAAAATTYIYNALGQRIKKGGGAVSPSVYFAYDEAGHLLGEYNISGSTVTTVQETVWLGDIPIATLRGGSVFYVHTDQLNTPRKVTNTSNQVRWKWDPTPFGEGSPVTNPNPPNLGTFTYNLRFPGQYFDSETNLFYNYFRDYDPAVGRYVESDPIGLRGGMNTYAYVGGNPISRTDPTGLVRECPLITQIFLALLPVAKIQLGSVWLCRYDCNTSCPTDSSLVFTEIQLRIYPDWGCRRTYLLY